MRSGRRVGPEPTQVEAEPRLQAHVPGRGHGDDPAAVQAAHPAPPDELGRDRGAEAAGEVMPPLGPVHARPQQRPGAGRHFADVDAHLAEHPRARGTEHPGAVPLSDRFPGRERLGDGDAGDPREVVVARPRPAQVAHAGRAVQRPDRRRGREQLQGLQRLGHLLGGDRVQLLAAVVLGAHQAARGGLLQVSAGQRPGDARRLRERGTGLWHAAHQDLQYARAVRVADQAADRGEVSIWFHNSQPKPWIVKPSFDSSSVTVEPMTRRTPAAWARVAFVMFAVGWGANQFSPMLIVYRHSLDLSADEIAGLFAIYAATLIPGLLVGGPLSDRFGRRACVLPFAALSPVATLLFVLGPNRLPLIAAGRALAGLCSGMVFGPATAWVQDLSGGDSRSARRAALALSAGFGLGPVVAAFLAQWAGDPLVVPYLPHLALGTAALVIGLTAPGRRTAPGPATANAASEPPGRRGLPPALRTREFWLGVALPAPFVFGTVSLAIVVLPEEVTSARTLSAGYAGLMTILAFAAGIGVQPAARRLAARRPHAGIVAG